MSKSQKFEVGYHLNTWDLAGKPTDGIPFLAEVGFKWFEALIANSLSDNFARKYMQLGHMPPPQPLSDTDFLKRLALFSRAQSDYGLKVASLYGNCVYTNPLVWPHEFEALQAITRFLKGCDSKILVLGGGPPAQNGDHSDEDYRAFASALEEIGAYSQKLGIRTVYHPHLDCFIETGEQLDRFMEIVNTDLVGLCIDPTHLQIKGSDPVEITRKYIEHVDYFHYKDCKDFEGKTGYDRYLSFCELGAGEVDLPALTQILIENDYDGLAIIELDASQKSAEESCRESIEYITHTLGLKLNLDD